MYRSTGSPYSFQGLWSLLTNWYSKFPDKHPNYDKKQHIYFDVPTAPSDENYKHLICLSREQFADTFSSFAKDAKYRIKIMKNMSEYLFGPECVQAFQTHSYHPYFHYQLSKIKKKATSVRECLMETYVPACLVF